ncbi:DUF115 domain-containing protein [Desulfobotulus sp. H1]|uniref:DUF115 domain-containing protein n=1 Tax=Desulfobotulus pelophilus TaxID=2823377 RepID=A0ABT3N4K9_9BACT|nr:DUF115 domain-containing protein [Desulfobotulus pelophilus]
MTSFFASNMALVEQYHPHLLPHLKGLTPFPVSSEHPENFRFKNIWMHDVQNPGNECHSHFNTVTPQQSGAVILLGMGLGHGASRLVEQRPGIAHFFIFERHPEVFLQALCQKDLSLLLKDKRVHIFLTDPEDMAEAISPANRILKLENAFILPHQPSLQMDPDGYENLRQDIYKRLNQLNVSGSTLMLHGSTFFKNRMSILPLIQKNRLLQELANAFQGVPAILIAGGPSLTQELDTLKKFQGRAVLFAVDTVLPALASNNIVPDFVTSLDYQELTYEKIAPAAPFFENRVNLISMPFVTRKVPCQFPFKEIFWAFSTANLERWINHLMGGSMENGGAGTVAHMNMIAAISLGCSPIVLLGQDLCYPMGKNTHVQSTVLSFDESGKIEDRVNIQTNNGIPAFTNRGFYDFKVFFEQMIKANPGHYINATLPGAVIEGTEVMPLQDILPAFCTKEVSAETIINQSSQHVPWKHAPEATEKALRATLKSIQKLEKVLRVCQKEGNSALQGVDKLIHAGKQYPSLTTLPSPLHRAIEAADKAHKQADREKIWALMDDITLEGLRTSERMLMEIDRLAENGPYLQWLRLSLERLNEISRVRMNSLSLMKSGVESAIQSMEKNPAFHPEKNLSLLEALRFFHETDDLASARKVISQLSDEEKNMDEVLLIRGKIAATYMDYEKANGFFSKIHPPPLQKEVDKFRKKWGDTYTDFAALRTSANIRVSLRMLQKGLAMAPDHYGLTLLLQRLFRRMLHSLQQRLEQGPALLTLWEDWLSDNPMIQNLLPPSDFATFLEIRAEKEEKDRQPEKARVLLELAQTKEETAPRHIKLMHLCFSLEYFTAGLQHLQAATDLDAEMAVHWESIGDRLEANGEDASALEAYGKGLALLPLHAPLHLKTGQIFLRHGDIDQARHHLTIYKELLEKPAQAPEAGIRKEAEQLMAKEKPEEALQLLIPLQHTQNNDADFWNLFGCACHRTGRMQDAEQCFRTALSLTPDHSLAHYHLGLLLQENGYFREAEATYSNALRADPEMTSALTNLGVLAFNRGEYEAAAGHFEKVLAFQPLYPDAFYNYAKTLEAMGKKEQALKAYDLVLELNPDHSMALSAQDNLRQNKKA